MIFFIGRITFNVFSCFFPKCPWKIFFLSLAIHHEMRGKIVLQWPCIISVFTISQRRGSYLFGIPVETITSFCCLDLGYSALLAYGNVKRLSFEIWWCMGTTLISSIYLALKWTVSSLRYNLETHVSKSGVLSSFFLFLDTLDYTYMLIINYIYHNWKQLPLHLGKIATYFGSILKTKMEESHNHQYYHFLLSFIIPNNVWETSFSFYVGINYIMLEHFFWTKNCFLVYGNFIMLFCLVFSVIFYIYMPTLFSI